MSFKFSLASSLIIAAILIGVSISLTKPKPVEAIVEAIINVPFSGKLKIKEICCNGIKFSLTQPPISTPATISSTFIFPWQNMVPIPEIGWGLYSWWSLTNGTTVLGSAHPGGQCITIASECEQQSSVDYSVNQMGTNLI